MIVDLFLGISFETMSNYFWDKPNAINKPIHQSQMDAILENDVVALVSLQMDHCRKQVCLITRRKMIQFSTREHVDRKILIAAYCKLFHRMINGHADRQVHRK